MLTAAAAMSISCTKQDYKANDCAKSETVSLTVGIEGFTLTKAASVGNETKVNNLQIFVFRPDGSLDAYGSSAGTQLSINCTAGTREIYAVVNAAQLSGLSSKSALLASTSNLSDNSSDSFEMIGSVSKVLPQSSAVTIPVKRIVSRISIDKVTARFESEAYRGMEFKVTDIYLINVAGSINRGLDASPSVWYNKTTFSGDLPEFTCDAGIEAVVTEDSPYVESHYFYAYPNPSSDSSSDTWCPRYTRLVIETKLGEKVYYYPINIPDIANNRRYSIKNLIITKPGSETPDQPVVSDSFSFDVEVSPWEIGFEKEETI